MKIVMDSKSQLNVDIVASVFEGRIDIVNVKNYCILRQPITARWTDR